MRLNPFRKKEDDCLPAALNAPGLCAPSEKIGWNSPAYTDSKSIALDHDRLCGNRCLGMSPDAGKVEVYKVLRTRIQQQTQAKGWNTVMVTSALPGEGKTLTAINLATTFAREFDHTVLLVDCDLKAQMIHRYLGIDGDTGLIDYLLDDRPLEELIVWPGVEKLTLISGGRNVQDSAELLKSPRMQDLVAEMKNRYADRYILFDAPPLLGRADAMAFVPLVDAVVIVVEAGRTAIQDIKRAADMIPREKFLGFVLNRAGGRVNPLYA